MKSCTRCNLSFPASLKFCEACGDVLTEAATLRCPACGEAVQPGWRFCTTCRSVLPSADTAHLPKSIDKQVSPPNIPPPSSDMNVTAPQFIDGQVTRASHHESVGEPQIRVRCRSCRSLVDEDSEFCEFCGASMFEDSVTRTPPQSPQPRVPSNARGEETHRLANHGESHQPSSMATLYAPSPPPPPQQVSPPRSEKTPPSLSMLSSYETDKAPPASFRWWYGLLLLFLLVFVGGLAAGGWWWWSNRGNTPQSAGTAQTPSSSSRPSEVNNKSASSAADDELTALRERRLRAQPSEGSKIVADLEAAEKKYPNDYRFPYERAKLSIKGVISHHEAFEALFLAAEKAIDNGKAQDMFNDLSSDKDGDFYKASRGHREWGTLMEALKNNDKAHLKEHGH